MFLFNDTATTEIYTLSLHDALPIFFHAGQRPVERTAEQRRGGGVGTEEARRRRHERAVHDHVVQRDVVSSEEHTSELQSRQYLVCRLLLAKKKSEPGRLLL